jgi:hypothetical protein
MNNTGIRGFEKQEIRTLNKEILGEGQLCSLFMIITSK